MDNDKVDSLLAYLKWWDEKNEDKDRNLEGLIGCCKEALEQPAQEPVAIVYSMQDGYIGQMVVKDIPHKTKLYTHPAPSWQGLSDDEIWNIANFLGKNKEWDYPVMFAKTIEQALNEKNTP